MKGGGYPLVFTGNIFLPASEFIVHNFLFPTLWFAMSARALSILLRSLGVLLILYGGLIIAVPLLLPYAVAWSPNHLCQPDIADDPGPSELIELGVSQHLRIPVGAPEASLSCFVLEPPSGASARGTILVLHGHRDNKLTQLDIGHKLADAGYRAVLVDHRGHGRSTGEYLSYGVVESRDMMAVLDTLQRRGLVSGRVGVLGFSYGGSVGIQLAAKDDRVGALVTVSTFCSLRGVVEDYVNCFLPFVAPFVPAGRIDEAVQKAGRVGGYDAAAADTEQAMEKLRVPVLLFHGEEDRRIPVRHGERLARAARGEHRFVRLPDCGHGDVMSGSTGERILRESLQWFGGHLR